MVSGAAIEYSVAVRDTTFGAAIAGFGRAVLSSFEQADTATNEIQRHPRARYFTDNLHDSYRTA
jgi:activator of 2-hydroxyglutaryl-CoA dehydratase